MGNIYVVGSCNMDLVMKVTELPRPGHTVLGGTFSQVSGGKGANQAVAAQRTGGNVLFHAALGIDDFGDMLLAKYVAAGIDCSCIERDPTKSTGTAVILVDSKGENVIAVASGANTSVRPPAVPCKASVILIQGEIPAETVYQTIAVAGVSKIPVVLNNAPVIDIPTEYRSIISVLIVNEHEAGIMTGMTVSDRKAAGQAIGKLRDAGYVCVIITLGAGGMVWSESNQVCFQASFKVQPIDTTAAGDTFCGAFTARYVNGDHLSDAIRFASASAALSTMIIGAQTSIPDRTKVVDFLRTAPMLNA